MNNKYILMALSSVAYWLAFRENILFFEVLSWIQIVVAGLIILLAFGVVLYDEKYVKNLDIKEFINFPYLAISYCFAALNVWITWNTQFCYVYVFFTVVAAAFIYTVVDTIKERSESEEEE